MKMKTRSVLAIEACVALCALVWAWVPTGGEVTEQMPNAAVSAETAIAESAPETTLSSDDEPVRITMQSEPNKDPEDLAAAEEATAMTITETEPIPAAAVEPPGIVSSQELVPAPEPQTTTVSSDPYHTDIYPNNVYSEKLLYDADGNLIGKTITYPCAFGSDTIWIDGHAYYDMPGFGLIEWSGPSQVTENYTMFESGVKVGSMGEEDASSYSAAAPASELPEPIGEVIDQTISARPERNSIPPDYKPDTMPLADLIDGA
jgi:hypothetical protein